MPATVKSLKTIEIGCQQCKGQCWDKNQSKRQANARAFFQGPIPNACVDSELDGSMCPFKR